MSVLGTETAFAVGAEATALEKLDAKVREEEGALGAEFKVSPFHLGDMNITTPRNIIDAAYQAALAGHTNYPPAPGIDPLREALAEVVGNARGLSYSKENVIIQPGGKPVIQKFIMALMDPGDGVLYPNAGYPIFESQIDFFGGARLPYAYREGENGPELDLESLVTQAPQAKLLILNNYHNPTGHSMSDEEMNAVRDLVVKYDLVVLADEAYFDINYGGKGKSIASLEGMKDRTVILYTFSKKYAMTGWRMGAAIVPEELSEPFTRLTVNDVSGVNHFAQYGGLEALTGEKSEAAAVEILGELDKRRHAVVNGLNSIEGVRCSIPQSTFYAWADVTGAMERVGTSDLEEFRQMVLKKTGVSFAHRNHFGSPLEGETRQYARFAYSGIGVSDIEEGLPKLKAFVEK